jgi:hypothetical protein
MLCNFYVKYSIAGSKGHVFRDIYEMIQVMNSCKTVVCFVDILNETIWAHYKDTMIHSMFIIMTMFLEIDNALLKRWYSKKSYCTCISKFNTAMLYS